MRDPYSLSGSMHAGTGAHASSGKGSNPVKIVKPFDLNNYNFSK